MIPTLLLALGLTTLSYGQSVQTTEPPYKRLGVLPAMGLLALDSVTITTLNTLPKDMPVLVVCFSTTCDHCQVEAMDLVKNKDKFKKVRIIMLTPEKLVYIKEFYEKYDLSKIKNLVIGKDYRYFAPSFYTFKKFPFTVLYNKNHEYLEAMEGTSTSHMILDKFKTHKAL